MGTVILIILLAAEAYFLGWSVITKTDRAKEKSVVRIGELLLLALLLATGVLEWGFRYFMILAVLLILAVRAVFVLAGKKEKPYKLGRAIRVFVGSSLLFAFALFLAVLCPQYVQPKTTGHYEIATAKYTWTDESRVEKFSKTGDNRAVTVDFWYPKSNGGTYPLVVFSHGAFGFSGSNTSTFRELASNGYVVASIGHTYHAFFTADTKGKITLVDQNFLNSVMEINNINDKDHEKQIYDATQQWMALRTADENFVLDTVIKQAKQEADGVFAKIDTAKIGLFGHSLGGASSVQVGRTRGDISAVIDLDGTMLGEDIGFENGKAVINNSPYPVPLLDIYAQNHYQNAVAYVGMEYENFNTEKNAKTAYAVVFKNAGHLNFTDLPLFSPTLARMLGVGTVNAKACIEKTNSIVLQFFNCYLKGGEKPHFEKEYDL